MQSFHGETIGDTSSPEAAATAQLAIETGVRLTRLARRAVRASPTSTLSLARLRALAFLVENPAVCVSDVAEHLFVGVPTASRLVDDLVERGLLTRDADLADRRRAVLTATSEGETLLATAARPAHQTVAALIGRLDPAERATVREGLTLLRSLLEPAEAPDA